jgi:hypothetical protein
MRIWSTRLDPFTGTKGATQDVTEINPFGYEGEEEETNLLEERHTQLSPEMKLIV